VAVSIDDVAHLMRRTGYACTAADTTAWTGGTLDVLVDHVLDSSSNPAVVAPAFLADATLSNYERSQQLVVWWLNRMATVPSPLEEKMTFFWTGHFVIESGKIDSSLLLWNQNQLYRANALGNFRTFTQAMAIDPAMLIYLDNRSNVKTSPNQNFARELQELFTLGIGNYSEDDVIAAARAWTGYGVGASPTYAYTYTDARHDGVAKTIYGVTQAWTGPQMIDFLFDDPTKQLVMARYIATKLWEFFAHPVPPAGVIDALATMFVAGSFELKPLLKALFLRPEFYLDAAKQGLVRTPVDLSVAVRRLTGITADGTTGTNDRGYLAGMGQWPYSPPNVAGWKANSYWLSTSSVTSRLAFARNAANRLVANHFPLSTTALSVADAVSRVLDVFGIISPGADLVGVLTRWLTDARAKNWAAEADLMALTMLSPEFQVA
jgi:uncharacterized protein (DUF1800 family)